MIFFRSVVDRTAKYIQHASIDMHIVNLAQAFVHGFRILANKITNLEDPQVTQVLRHARADPRNFLKYIRHLLIPVPQKTVGM